MLKRSKQAAPSVQIRHAVALPEQIRCYGPVQVPLLPRQLLGAAPPTTQDRLRAHCALEARESCEWVGFIDIDEFLHFPGNQTHVLQNYTDRGAQDRVPQLWSVRPATLAGWPRPSAISRL
jgi:hypothetical protein